MPSATINRALEKSLCTPRSAPVGTLSLVVILILMGLGEISALAQSDCLLSACSSPGRQPLPPFWPILNGGTPFTKVTINGSTCAWYHNTSSMVPGQGWGVVDTCATVPGDGVTVVYEVLITQPNVFVSSDIIMNVTSTNCDIGSAAGGPPPGGGMNTTAFQAGFSVNRWARVCWLTNHVGVVQPEVEFRYVSGTNGRTYMYEVWFSRVTFIGAANPMITCVGLTGGQCSIGGTGVVGKAFILLQSSDASAPMSSWTPAQTNNSGAGNFGFMVDPVAANSMFFRVQAQ